MEDGTPRGLGLSGGGAVTTTGIPVSNINKRHERARFHLRHVACDATYSWTCWLWFLVLACHFFKSCCGMESHPLLDSGASVGDSLLAGLA